MSGIIDTVGSKSGIVGSDVYPAGHTVKQSVFNDEVTATLSFATASYVDSGLEVAHTTALSSADSYLRVDFFHAMAEITASGVYGLFDATMRTVSNSTHTAAESLSPGDYPTFLGYQVAGDFYWPMSLRYHCGLESGMSMPATKTSWAAGDTLYFRWFGKRGGTGSFKLYSGSVCSMTVMEVVR